MTIVSPGGAEQTLALEALAGGEDVADRAYVVRSAQGEASQAVTGFSLAALIEAAGADPYGFSYLEVQRPSGGAVQLSRDQALDPDAFADGPPVVYAGAGGTGFLRPSAGADDLNAADSFTAPQGLAIVLRKGMALRVKAEASALKLEPGQKVSFEALVERAGSGEELTYSWNFDDGHSAAGQRVSHSFAKPGSYDVVLGATSSGNEAGAADVVSVQVGEPAGGGPERKGGGTNRAKDAPDHGAASGGAGTGGGASDAGGALPPIPDSTASAPAPAPEPAQGTARFQTPLQRAKGTTEPAGEKVSGELLAAGAAPAPAARARQVAARRGNLDHSGAGGGMPAEGWGALATLGLLGAGVLLEARGLSWLAPGRGGGGIA